MLNISMLGEIRIVFIHSVGNPKYQTIPDVSKKYTKVDEALLKIVNVNH